MDKADSEETFHMPSIHLKQMYHLRKYVQYIASQAPTEMDLDHEDHPLTMANWSPHSDHTFMKFVFQQEFHPKTSHKQQVSNQQLAGFKKGIKREVTSYPTLQQENIHDVPLVACCSCVITPAVFESDSTACI